MCALSLGDNLPNSQLRLPLNPPGALSPRTFRHPLAIHEDPHEHGEPDADGSTDPQAGAQVASHSSYRCSDACAEDG